MTEEKIAKISEVLLGYEGHGIFTCQLQLDYGGATQGAGNYTFGTDSGFGIAWIQNLMAVAGVDDFSKVKGKTVLALLDERRLVVGLRQLPTEGSKGFVFEDLAKDYQ